MATDLKTVATVPLNGTNYSTWKVQCQMALVCDGLWGMVNETETVPDEGEADRHSKFLTRQDRTLAINLFNTTTGSLGSPIKYRYSSDGSTARAIALDWRP